MTAIATPDISQHPRSRAPRGVDVSRRIVVSLMPHERSAFDALAARDGRTSSSMARILLLQAIESDPAARQLLADCKALEHA
ncbi:hypothetical protein CGK74_13805 [Thauera propionica]|uniref:CopG family transcriptional regulator n=1 Tax=Thauera propionica TaxID=2019431 RepID=A0A235EWX2_9RHOO|nr:hypothetical protein [Thauera propionica]OYD53283.1 hypothetical protein CGK74_13805 [Thauera propionica]